MNKTQELTYEDWSTVIRYEPDTGKFYRLKARSSHGVGEVKGTINSRGYVVISLNRRPTLAHRVAWLLMTREWPKDQIDHINRDKTDNRWINFRAATLAQNNANAIKSKPRALPTGVNLAVDSPAKPFMAHISVDNRKRFLGCFATAEEASRAYLAAKRRFHGEFNPYSDPAG